MVQAAGPADHQDSPYIIVRQNLRPRPAAQLLSRTARGRKPDSQTQFCGQQEQLSHIPISAHDSRGSAIPNASEGLAMLA